MNFLFHHRLAKDELGGAAGAGAMLPDLWRMIDRRARPSRGAASEGSIDRGIAHHLAVDAWFHASPVFLEGEERVAETVRNLRLEAPRMGLFAHILWELCLDGALLRAVGFDATMAELREDFAVHAAAIERAAVDHHLEPRRLAETEVALFRERMGRLTTELLRGPWIEGYANGLGVAVRISGVRVRVGLSALGMDDTQHLADGLDALGERADAVASSILRAER